MSNRRDIEIVVLSRTKARKLFFGGHITGTACIAITDYYAQGRFSRSIYPGKTLFLQFDDTDCDVPGCIPISQKQAESIAAFVRRVQADESIHKLVVHCEAGVSRSAGVAAAVMKWWTGDDSTIFDNGWYKPNMLCYRMVLNALYAGDEEVDNAGE